MNFLSVCSGIDAASVAWGPLGWSAVGFSEIEPFPSAVLKHHYPAVANFGDLTRFKEWPDAAFNVLVGGTPCQSFGVAGLRAGLDDSRGNLMLTFAAVARRYRPTWVVWENVPGVLSSDKGRALAAFLWLMGECGYHGAWRVLDAQYFGVPQRRRRVFFVGHSRDWRRAAAVLFERESLRRNPAPSRETGEGVAPTISARTKGGGGLGTDFDCDGGLIPERARTPTTSNQRIDWETETLITHSLLDASEDGTGRGTPLMPVGITIHGTDKTARVASYTDVAGALRARTPGLQENSSTTAVMAFGWQNSSQQGASASTSTSKTPAILAPSLTATNDPSRSPQSQEITQQVAAIQAATFMVRRLTPRECERLQGFPDDYTLIPFRGKPAADGPRYKALGNSMAVPVMRFIGERIAFVDSIGGRDA